MDGDAIWQIKDGSNKGTLSCFAMLPMIDCEGDLSRHNKLAKWSEVNIDDETKAADPELNITMLFDAAAEAVCLGDYARFGTYFLAPT